MNVAIIPARGGSRRIPRKNIRLFHGQPIIWYSIKTAIDSGLFDSVFVSTEDGEIEAISFGAGAKVIHRPQRLAEDAVGTQEVAVQVLLQLEEIGLRPEFACVIYATAPLMQVADLKRGLAALIEHPIAPYAYSASLSPLRASGLLHDAGQFYWGRVPAFLKRVALDAEDVIKVIIAEARVCDINVESDWARAERMYAALVGQREREGKERG